MATGSPTTALSPPERLEAARELLGSSAMKVVTLYEPDPSKHSTLTGPDRNRAVVTEVVEFLRSRLGGNQTEGT